MEIKLPSVETLFGEALEIASDVERAAYLDRACDGDDALRRQVETLLAAYDRAGGFLEVPALAPTVTRDEAPPIAEGPGTVIGPYKLLEPIGEGGMGLVFMAEQIQPVRRKVALKIIKPGMDTRQVIARFEAERQALALMDHPNIARVLDAGATASGRPYFVMELVRGIPITDYCDQAQLSIPERLELFVLVCRAVQHAHQKGIIHRDLKPSNVLVTRHDGEPVPKVIDFGVAKATGQSLTDKTLYTSFAQMVGTPLYMSPEQAELSGLDVDTRSDIYSLGVLLYELLTGTTPFDRETFRNAAFDEIRCIIREQEPLRPSTRLSTLGATLATVSMNRHTDPRRLGQSVRGELDWIVMKALEKDRRRRYETANALAADVVRYLTDRPVEACPPSAGYRLRKYARRHRAALAMATVVTASLLIVSLGSLVAAYHFNRLAVSERQSRLAAIAAQQRAGLEANRANRALVQSEHAHAEAVDKAAEARAVVGFLLELIGSASPLQAQGATVTVEEVLARADGRIEATFADQPLVEAAVRHTLGETYTALGHSTRAVRHLERALALSRDHRGPEHPETLRLMTDLGEALNREGTRRDEARALLEAALADCRRVLGPEHEQTLQAMNTLAFVRFMLGQDQPALALYEQALEIQRRTLGRDHPSTLTTEHNLAYVLGILGRTREALPLYEHIVAIERRERPHHPNTLNAMSYLAHLLEDLDGRAEEVLALRKQAMAGAQRVLGLGHPATLIYISSYNNFLIKSGAAAEALAVLEQTLRQARRELGPEDPVTIHFTGELASLLLLRSDHEGALALAESLPDLPETLDPVTTLARELVARGHTAEARALFERAVALQGRVLADEDSITLKRRNYLALLLRDDGRPEEARSLFEEVLAVAERLLEPAPPAGWSRDQVHDAESERARARFLRETLDRARGPIDPDRAPLTIDAPFRAVSPVADGRIDPDEYGPPLEVTFDDDRNPGRLWRGGPSRTKAPDDLSFQRYAAHTDDALFLAFRVRDQFVDRDDHGPQGPIQNDNIEVFLNGDRVANDFTFVMPGNQRGNREGIQFVADALGQKFVSEGTTDITVDDWTVGASLTADGYIIEFEIPRALIDTQDGPGVAPATPGAVLLMNVGITDNDASIATQSDYGILWAEEPILTPYLGGEDFWPVALRLTPGPETE